MKNNYHQTIAVVCLMTYIVMLFPQKRLVNYKRQLNTDLAFNINKVSTT